MQIVDNKLCCGCGACADACPKKCIAMDYNEYGFLMSIVGEGCVDCGLCKKVCPAQNPIQREEIKAVYKGYRKEKEKDADKESSSGALFPALAEKIISEQGVVVGAVFEDGFKNVKHVLVEDMTGVESCRGSKYIQSQTAGIYEKTKRALKDGRKVLFSGTPCQIAGLKGFLRADYDNLYTMDFICHGVASTAYWQAFLESVADGKKLAYVSFRNKDNGFTSSGIKIVTDDGVTLVEEPIAQEPIFGKAFANNLLARDSCGGCQYAARTRCADITLADNMIDCTDEEKKKGSSFIFINTQKGQALFDFVKADLCAEEKDAAEIIAKMMHLNGPAKPHKDREKLLTAFKEKGVDEAKKYVTVYSAETPSLWVRIKAKIKRLLKR